MLQCAEQQAAELKAQSEFDPDAMDLDAPPTSDSVGDSADSAASTDKDGESLQVVVALLVALVVEAVALAARVTY